MDWDVVVVGSGVGGLTAGALLARYGKRVLVCESHSVAGGAAHSFQRDGFCFDSGPSFYCGIGKHSGGLNPLKQVLDVLEESVETVAYDPLGFYHFPEGTFPVWSSLEKYCQQVASITAEGAGELVQFQQRLLQLYDCLKDIPTIALRSDWGLAGVLLRFFPALVKMLPQVGVINSSVGQILDRYVKDPWVRRLVDLECFLLSGLKAHGTIAPEVAFMLGERNQVGVEYPLGGSGAIVNALVRGLEKWGGKLRLRAHVDKIRVERGRVVGVQLKGGETINSEIVISNATIWDTYAKLLSPSDLPPDFRQQALATPAVDSFMHLHLGIKAAGLKNLCGHHVVVNHQDKDITAPGNTCMISIPSVWDSSLAPPGYHQVHVYSLEPYEPWENTQDYGQLKNARSPNLYRALSRVIPDIQERVTLELIGTPLTHSRFLRRYQGTYGPAISAEKGMFPSCHTPISGLYRVGDSTTPGIGVPATAASGILCANTLVSPSQTRQLVDLIT